MKLNEYLSNHKDLFNERDVISGNALKSIVPELLKLDEFKGSIIHIIDYPNYLGDKNGVPITPDQEPLVSDNQKIPCQTHLHKFGTQTEFNTIVALYSIGLAPKEYDLTLLDTQTAGAWILPVNYVGEEFTPVKEIRIKFNPEVPQGFHVGISAQDIAKQQEQQVKASILQKVQDLLSLKEESNLTYQRAIIIRCSLNSVKTHVREKADCYV